MKKRGPACWPALIADDDTTSGALLCHHRQSRPRAGPDFCYSSYPIEISLASVPLQGVNVSLEAIVEFVYYSDYWIV